MPGQPRPEPPEVRHHVMVRGIERHAILRDDTDRADFVACLALLAERGHLTVCRMVCRGHPGRPLAAVKRRGRPPRPAVPEGR